LAQGDATGRKQPVSSVSEAVFIPLPRDFYEPSAEIVAPRLLGHWLLRRTEDGLSGGLIVETEAYLADDPACHAFQRETVRTRAMYGPPGHAYVYFIYGNHWCFNAVCRPAGMAEAVLIRAIESNFGAQWMQARRATERTVELTNGPAKLCQALAIDRSLDTVDLCSAASAIFIAENPGRSSLLKRCGPVVTTTRIGITKAAERRLRFYLEGSAYVSKRAR
jgi:DNA-3-methyladenine glycosylase